MVSINRDMGKIFLDKKTKTRTPSGAEKWNWDTKNSIEIEVAIYDIDDRINTQKKAGGENENNQFSIDIVDGYKRGTGRMQPVRRKERRHSDGKHVRGQGSRRESRRGRDRCSGQDTRASSGAALGARKKITRGSSAGALETH